MRGTLRELQSNRHRHSPIALRQGLPDSASVSPRRTRTADFDQSDRVRLAEAVVVARTAAGWPTTMDLIRAVGRSQRAIYALENGEPTVGQSILQAVGATLGERLQGWHANTPREILEGQPAPPLAPLGSRTPAPPSRPVLTEEDNRRFELIEQLFRSWGIEMTPRMLEVFHDEIGRQLDARRRRESAPDTERVRSDEDG
jgi:hypothetical protein